VARLEFPKVDDDPGMVAAVAAEVSQQRHGTLPNLYRMLLHCPELAAGWLQLGTAVRYRSSLDDVLRELAICAVARICDSGYEWAHHAPLARRAGATEHQLASLPDDLEDAALTPARRAALAYVAGVARLDVSDAVFAAVAEHFSAAEVVELTATASYYAGVARFLGALQVDIDDGLR
jgi:alkylhydroperoxidase family enzyme